MLSLVSECETNWKSMHLKYSKLGQPTYFTALKPKYARVIFKARTRMYDIKANFQRNMKAVLSVISVDGMPKALSTFSNVRID